MFKQDEKILILGALFHDIGKFVQRCTITKFSHNIEGKKFIDDNINLKESFTKIIGKDGYDKFLGIIENHHKPKTNIEKIVQEADWLSASERIDSSEKEDLEKSKDWSHKHLSSIFSKLKLTSDINEQPKYYKQSILLGNETTEIIPSRKI